MRVPGIAGVADRELDVLGRFVLFAHVATHPAGQPAIVVGLDSPFAVLEDYEFLRTTHDSQFTADGHQFGTCPDARPVLGVRRWRRSLVLDKTLSFEPRNGPHHPGIGVAGRNVPLRQVGPAVMVAIPTEKDRSAR